MHLILSIDAVLALLLTTAAATAFLQTTSGITGMAIGPAPAYSTFGNFDFSMKEIAGQQFADEVALGLQSEATALNELHNGNTAAVDEQLAGIADSRYCIEVETKDIETESFEEKNIAGNRNGNCTGLQAVNNSRNVQKITRNVPVYAEDELFLAKVTIYLLG